MQSSNHLHKVTSVSVLYTKRVDSFSHHCIMNVCSCVGRLMLLAMDMAPSVVCAQKVGRHKCLDDCHTHLNY